MDLRCNRSDEITLQPALDHLTHVHTGTHTHISLRRGLTHACPASLDSAIISKLIHILPPTSDCGAVDLHTRRSIKRKLTTPKKSFRLEIRVALGLISTITTQ
ncbi:hypothetical protein FJTKL_09429 [Diaporthe vaccinii]|uniref:Uncharacterized protein n=1 Tax=Diaporthe vaccinii TaxID=105482 RepID=A0ABR4FCN2_9PEZI